MALKIIGAGFGRTGTLSLKQALETLGFGPCYHMMELLPEHVDFWRRAGRGETMNWDDVFADWQATVDWPSCNWWREQLAQYPDAKVILSRRDSAGWYKSIMNTIYPSSKAGRAATDPAIKARVDMAFEVIWDGLFDGRMDDEAHVVSVFERHNQAVIDGVPADQLLVYTPGDGWGPLCEFLGVAEPAEDYPSVNSTEDFKRRFAAMRGDGD